MLIIPPPQFRKRRGQSKQPPRPPGAALVLVSATYEPEDPSLLLAFDRAINVTKLVGSLIVVEDRDNGLLLQGSTAERLTAEIVQVDLEVVGSSTGSGVWLTAGAGNGIVA